MTFRIQGVAWTVGVLPLSTQLAGEGLLVGVGHHVPSQVLLVLGGEAAAGALVWPQVRV